MLSEKARRVDRERDHQQLEIAVLVQSLFRERNIVPIWMDNFDGFTAVFNLEKIEQRYMAMTQRHKVEFGKLRVLFKVLCIFKGAEM